MLHAFNQKKSRLYQRYLGVRHDPQERRITAEDEITSLVMGPLAFLGAPSIGLFWQKLIALQLHDVDFPAGAPDTADMWFWPKREGIEPDLHVRLCWGDQTRTVLVEFKWRAPLSTPTQLHDQWRRYLEPEEQANAYHLFIGLDASEALGARARDDIWNGRLLACNWFNVMTVLTNLEALSHEGLVLWSKQVTALFALLNVPTFRGFETLEAVPRPNACPEFFNSPQLPRMYP
ncbi:hypothetical protein [Pseudomonas faucium]|uniref:hypothetical protein n=1 Tax=Pseudomonas faucium TaxID=2740518 RepID=UPI001F427341|nr:hypothetical protein [Pseudomonas faucium]